VEVYFSGTLACTIARLKENDPLDEGDAAILLVKLKLKSDVL